MNRRGFFGLMITAVGLVAGVWGKAKAAPPLPPLDSQFKLVFRHDGEYWREIQWEDQKPGDKVLIVGIHSDGTLRTFEVWEFLGFEDRHEGGGPVAHVDGCMDLLPRVWGVKSAAGNGYMTRNELREVAPMLATKDDAP